VKEGFEPDPNIKPDLSKQKGGRNQPRNHRRYGGSRNRNNRR